MTPLRAIRPEAYPVLVKDPAGEWFEYASLTEAADEFRAREEWPEGAIELADPNPVDCLADLEARLRAAPIPHEDQERGMLRW